MARVGAKPAGMEKRLEYALCERDGHDRLVCEEFRAPDDLVAAARAADATEGAPFELWRAGELISQFSPAPDPQLPFEVARRD